MKTNHLFIFLCFLFICSCNQPSNELQTPQQFKTTNNPEEVGMSADRLKRIDSVMLSYIENGTLPNAATFISRKGKVLNHKAFGYRNIEEQVPLEENSVFRIASQTKAIVSVALMTLYEKGYFLLDDPVSKFIPEFKDPTVLVEWNKKDTTFTTRPAKSKITIRHLLSHSSGIVYDHPIYQKHGIIMGWSKDSIRVGETIRKLAKLPLMFDPGEKYNYGLNTDVIGFLVEIISGKDLSTYLHKMIFEPLGMNSTWFYLPESEYNRYVSLYGRPSAEDPLEYSLHPVFQDFAVSGAKMYFSGGAGLCGTIEDYARFCQMMLNGGEFNNHRILSPKTVELMLRNHLPESENWQFGLGFHIYNEKDASKNLGSVGAFKWGGMYYTDYLIDPVEDMVMLIYTNVFPYRGPDVHTQFRNLAYQAIIE